jgi:hypothetical protein
VCCDITAHHIASWRADQFPLLRQRPGADDAARLPANLLKHSDEQTIAALAAVLRAIADFRMPLDFFADWGIVSAPCFLGRSALANALDQFAVDGPWGISPHLIPHRSQHAVSGTISLALNIRGPNFGAGGGSDGPTEGLLSAAALLAENSIPGVWVTVTGWDPDLLPGKDNSRCACWAVALALVSRSTGSANPYLVVSGGATPGYAAEREPTMARFATLLEPVLSAGLREARTAWVYPGGWIELGREKTTAPLREPHFLHRLSGGRSDWTQAGRAGMERKG